MMRSPFVAQERLGLVADLLLASGWKRDGDCWLAPEDMRERLAIEGGVGRGAVALWIAVAAQIQLDHVVASSSVKAA